MREAPDVFRSQEAGIQSDLAELTKGPETTAAQEAMFAALAQQLEHARAEVEMPRRALSAESDARMTIQKLFADAQRREHGLQQLVDGNAFQQNRWLAAHEAQKGRGCCSRSGLRPCAS